MKHYFIYSTNPAHGAIFTKGLRSIRSFTGALNRIEFKYNDEKSIWWGFDSKTEKQETLLKLKKSLINGVNIDNNITL